MALKLLFGLFLGAALLGGPLDLARPAQAQSGCPYDVHAMAWQFESDMSQALGENAWGKVRRDIVLYAQVVGYFLSQQASEVGQGETDIACWRALLDWYDSDIRRQEPLAISDFQAALTGLYDGMMLTTFPQLQDPNAAVPDHEVEAQEPEEDQEPDGEAAAQDEQDVAILDPQNVRWHEALPCWSSAQVQAGWFDQHPPSYNIGTTMWGGTYWHMPGTNLYCNPGDRGNFVLKQGRNFVMYTWGWVPAESRENWVHIANIEIESSDTDSELRPRHTGRMLNPETGAAGDTITIIELQ